MKSLIEFLSEGKDDGPEYQKKLKAALKKFGYSGIGDIPKDKKDEFFEYMDKQHTSDKEEDGIDEAAPKARGPFNKLSKQGKSLIKAADVLLKDLKFFEDVSSTPKERKSLIKLLNKLKSDLKYQF